MKEILIRKSKGSTGTLYLGIMWLLLVIVFALFCFRMYMLTASVDMIEDTLTDSLLAPLLMSNDYTRLHQLAINYNDHARNASTGGGCKVPYTDYEKDILRMSRGAKFDKINNQYTVGVSTYINYITPNKKMDSSETMEVDYIDETDNYFKSKYETQDPEKSNASKTFLDIFQHNLTNGQINQGMTNYVNKNDSAVIPVLPSNAIFTEGSPTITNSNLKGYLVDHNTDYALEITDFAIINVYRAQLAHRVLFQSDFCKLTVENEGTTPKIKAEYAKVKVKKPGGDDDDIDKIIEIDSLNNLELAFKPDKDDYDLDTVDGLKEYTIRKIQYQRALETFKEEIGDNVSGYENGYLYAAAKDLGTNLKGLKSGIVVDYRGKTTNHPLFFYKASTVAYNGANNPKYNDECKLNNYFYFNKAAAGNADNKSDDYDVLHTYSARYVDEGWEDPIVAYDVYEYHKGHGVMYNFYGKNVALASGKLRYDPDSTTDGICTLSSALKGKDNMSRLYAGDADTKIRRTSIYGQVKFTMSLLPTGNVLSGIEKNYGTYYYDRLVSVVGTDYRNE